MMKRLRKVSFCFESYPLYSNGYDSHFEFFNILFIFSENEVTETAEPEKKAQYNDVLTLTGICENEEINKDAKFVDDFHIFMHQHQTSKLFIPFMSQFKVIQRKAKKSVKMRIDQQLKVFEWFMHIHQTLMDMP